MNFHKLIALQKQMKKKNARQRQRKRTKKKRMKKLLLAIKTNHQTIQPKQACLSM
jgi:hypothetical protein